MKARNSTSRLPHFDIAENLRTGQPFRRSIDRSVLLHLAFTVLGCYFLLLASIPLRNADLNRYLQPQFAAILEPVVAWGIPGFLALYLLREIFGVVVWARSRVAVCPDYLEIYEWHGRTRKIDFSEILALTAFAKLMEGESAPSGHWSLWVCHQRPFSDKPPRWSHIFSGRKKDADLIRNHLLEAIDLPTEANSDPDETPWRSWRREDIDDLPPLNV